MSFGQTLRTAREAKGITPSELAARTHMLVQIVEGMEKEDFRRIPAPIYGRGFVKLYCAEVGLDPKPLQDEFMALYTLGKDAPAKVAKPTAQKPKPEKKTEPEPQPPPPEPAPEPEPQPPPPEPAPYVQPAPEPVAEPPPPVPAPVTQPAPEPPAAPVTPVQAALPIEDAPPKPEKGVTISNEPPPRRSYGELFEQTYATPEPEKPSAAEKFRDTMSNVSHGVFANVKQKLPPNTGRIATVCIAAVLLLALLGWGLATLYKATSAPADPTPVAEIQPTTPKPTATPQAKPTEKPSAKPATKPAEKTAPKAAPKASPQTSATQPSVKPGTKPSPAKGKGVTRPQDLKSTGQKIPPLYID